jgi:hypothetical protein
LVFQLRRLHLCIKEGKEGTESELLDIVRTKDLWYVFGAYMKE